MSEQRLAELEAEVAALRKELRLAAEFAGFYIRNTRADAGLPPVTYGPDTTDAPDDAVARLIAAMMRRS